MTQQTPTTIQLTEGKCQTCDKEYFKKEGRFGLKYNKKHEKCFLPEFFKTINALLNDQGEGHVIIHVDAVEAYSLLDVFDQKVDDKLLKSLPDDLRYHDAFERYLMNENHLLYRVKPLDGRRTFSIYDFKSKFPLNKGIIDPSQREMKIYLRQLWETIRSPQTSGEVLYNLVLEYENQPLNNKDGRKEPFVESISGQAKACLEDKDKPKICWKHSKSYIAAFSKLETGGSVFLGLKEESNVKPKWTKVENADTVTEFTVNFKESVSSDYRLWKDIPDNDIYHIAKESEVQTTQYKSGKLLVQGVLLTDKERSDIEQHIKDNLTDEFCWIIKEQFKHPVSVRFLTVFDKDGNPMPNLFVVEVRVEYCSGLGFEDPGGPELYTRAHRQGRSVLQRVPINEDWLLKYKPDGCGMDTIKTPQIIHGKNHQQNTRKTLFQDW